LVHWQLKEERNGFTWVSAALWLHVQEKGFCCSLASCAGETVSYFYSW